MSPNPAAIAAEPGGAPSAAWLAAADPRTLANVARDVVAAVAARLLWASGRHNPGEAGVNLPLWELVARSPSPAVRALACDLVCDERGAEWGEATVVAAACRRLGLGTGPGVRRDVTRRLRRLP